MFDRRWAETLIEQVVTRLESECAVAGQSSRFDVLRDFVLGDPGDRSHAEAAAMLGLSEGAVTSAIHRLRNRFRELLRREVAETVEHPGDVDAELKDLLAILSG